jgi:hypothetical protein
MRPSSFRFLPSRRPALALAAALGLASLLPAADAPAPVAADPRASVWFVELGAGAIFIPGGDLTLAGVPYESDFGAGRVLQAAVGRTWGDQWRVQLEWVYRSNPVNELTGAGGRFTAGDLASTTALVTARYALPARWSVAGIRPYVSAGLGLMTETDLDLEGAGGGEFSTGGEWAWHWAIGLERPVGARGRLFLESRALSGGQQTLDATSGSRRVAVDYDAWTLQAGLRWSF